MRVSERDRRRVDNFNAVKTAFPLKVKGFVADLIKPIAKKYRVAVSSALGMHNLDAIVVDSRRTALDCIGELKRRRLGTATFLPLDGLKAKAIKTQNRRIASDVKLVLDLVSFRKEHQVLAEFLCGSAVYAETLDRAREVCYRRRETRNKFLTMKRTFCNPKNNFLEKLL
ncbi:Structural maintenance of chromosomes protein 1 [Bonamia ostreae]|uniref:Structural maintenance of chromosomes protein 1 n=1 Tax=Bonamia ostreae TaxID=126728 RepID=A0ABV2AG05_9EUKA